MTNHHRLVKVGDLWVGSVLGGLLMHILWGRWCGLALIMGQMGAGIKTP